MSVTQLTIDELLESCEQKDQTIMALRGQLVECKRVGRTWRERALNAEKKVAEYESVLGNKNLSSTQALTLVGMLRIVEKEKPRPSGKTYMNYEMISGILPVSSQAVGDAARVLADSGIVEVEKEPQKSGRGKNLLFAIPEQTRLNLAHVVVDNEKHPRAGGTRIHIHKGGCGGECIERQKYLCKKCGEDNIPAKDTLTVDKETWLREQGGIETEQTYLKQRAEREEQALCLDEEEENVPGELEQAAIQMLANSAAPGVAVTPEPTNDKGNVQPDYTTNRPVPRVGKHPRTIPCPECGAVESWYPVPTVDGEMFVCIQCYPDYLEGDLSA